MFPEITALQINKPTEEPLKQKKVFLFDYTKGDFVFQNGRLVEVEDIEGIKAWIDKILRTEKFRFKVYEKSQNRDSEYGITIQDLITGYNYNRSFIEAEIKREVETAILKNKLINSIRNFQSSFVDDKLTLSFEVVLKDNVIGYTTTL